MMWSSRILSLVDSVIAGPVNPPMSRAYARAHIKAISTSEDTLVDAWVLGAAQFFEEQTGRPPITQTREAWLDGFPDGRGRIELPHPPLQDVVSVLYMDDSGVLQPFSDGASPETLYYDVKAPQGPYAQRGWIEPIAGMDWPTTQAVSGAVRIQYRCGYGDDETDVPDLVKAILCFLIGNFDQFRSAVHIEDRGSITEVPYGVEMMLRGFRYSALSVTSMRKSSWA